VAALWAGLGFQWLAARWAWGRIARSAAAGLLLAAIFAAGSLWNWRAGDDWAARYAGAVLRSLPPDSSLVLFGDAELGPVAYYHLVEEVRPDVTLYQSQGLLLANRLVHPLRPESESASRDALRALVERETAPVAFIQDVPEGTTQRHRGLYIVADKAPGARASLELPPEVERFLRESLLGRNERDPWSRAVQSNLRERLGGVLALHLDPVRGPDDATAKALAGLAADHAGALGIAEGLMANPRGHSARQVAGYLEKARDLMPGDATKERRARFFELRAYLRLEQGEAGRAIEDLDLAIAAWPSDKNRARIAAADLRARLKP
jgi:hypothetical protein